MAAMTREEIAAGLNEQIAKAEDTLREVIWTAECLRMTLAELKMQKLTLSLLTGMYIDKGVTVP